MKYQPITARKQSLGQGNIFSSMCQEFCSQGKSGRAEPPGKADLPLARQTPWQGRHPPAQSILGDTVNKQAVCILLECILVTNSKGLISLFSLPGCLCKRTVS